MTTVSIIDYGIGNILSVSRALEKSGAEVSLVSSPEKIAYAGHLVLPGVGAYGDCIDELKARNLCGAIVEHSRAGKPLLGICVGMQLLFDRGEEFGDHAGLGLISGTVSPIPTTGSDNTPHPIPHIGWNVLCAQENKGAPNWDDSILEGVGRGDAVYFLHSFHALCEDYITVLACCDYNGRKITAVVQKGGTVGLQFHVEKSGPVGLQILQNFIALKF